jgi:hypothetical protein
VVGSSSSVGGGIRKLRREIDALFSGLEVLPYDVEAAAARAAGQRSSTWRPRSG